MRASCGRCWRCGGADRVLGWVWCGLSCIELADCSLFGGSGVNTGGSLHDRGWGPALASKGGTTHKHMHASMHEKTHTWARPHLTSRSRPRWSGARCGTTCTQSAPADTPDTQDAHSDMKHAGLGVGTDCRVHPQLHMLPLQAYQVRLVCGACALVSTRWL